MTKNLLFFILLLFPLNAEIQVPFAEMAKNEQQIVIATNRIELEDFPNAHNPSIIQVDDGYLMTFRFCPDHQFQPWLSYIGVVLLDESFQPISQPKLLNSRQKNSKTPSQSEDARIFQYRGRIFVIYNDNVDLVNPRTWERRDMYIAELLHNGNNYSLSTPLKLIYEEKYHTQYWQKNWIAFEWNKTLLISYTLDPHEILYANLLDGACYHCYRTSPSLNWDLGTLRGSTPPLKVDGEFLAFFHSSIITESPYSDGEELWHYFMGAYTFSADPPFKITKITPFPIVTDKFYTKSNYYKKVVFPGGFVVSKEHIYVAYGKDDCEIWIAKINKNALKKALKPVE